ncbi:unnamed protein product [Mytilus coruscus]|uniref:Uncharacterized protein n=1 Tax=Mytilus coruscus TaxID=42192 RepID=A0A6J8BZX8_MYTCO|nr:unnamed protein product [Mytilus coruscus]
MNLPRVRDKLQTSDRDVESIIQSSLCFHLNPQPEPRLSQQMFGNDDTSYPYGYNYELIDYTPLSDYKFVDHVEDNLEDNLEDFDDKCTIFFGEDQDEFDEEEDTQQTELRTIIPKSEPLVPPTGFSFQYPPMQLGQELKEKKIKFDNVYKPVITGEIPTSLIKTEQVAPGPSYSSPLFYK